jgi:hypothetical protein
LALPPPPPPRTVASDLDFKIDEDSISYNGKTLEKGDTVKWLRNKEGKLIKIGKKRVIVLRNDNHKERRLKVETFIKLNF